MRTRLTIAEARAERLRGQIQTFEVVPEYKALEREANEITREIDGLNVENVVDGDLLQQLRASLIEEDAPVGDVTKLYAEAGVVLPDMVRRRFDEVERFHRTIIENRRAHLNAEIGSAEARVAQRDQRIAERDRRRRQIMGVLRSGGALDHYTSLREEAGRVEAEVEGLRQRLETAERIESTKAELDIERANLTMALRDDIRERREVIREAILAFEALSESLYAKGREPDDLRNRRRPAVRGPYRRATKQGNHQHADILLRSHVDRDQPEEWPRSRLLDP